MAHLLPPQEIARYLHVGRTGEDEKVFENDRFGGTVSLIIRSRWAMAMCPICHRDNMVAISVLLLCILFWHDSVPT